MKSAIKIFLVSVVVILCFAGCSKAPKEPPTTAVENYSYVNPYGDKVTPPVNAETNKETEPTYLETVNNIEFVMSSYYSYNGCYAKITDVSLEYDSMLVDEVSGLASVEIIGKSLGEDWMKIGYIAYDKDGNVVRNTHFQAPLKGVGKGDIVEKCVFDFPDEAVKVVFHDYVEE